MKLLLKDYKTIKTKNFIKNSSFFIIFNGVNPHTSSRILTEQELKKLELSSYKLYNKTSKILIRVSIYKVIEPAINGITFLIKPFEKNKELSKQQITNNLKSLLFIMLVIKLNNKIYSARQFKHVNTLYYQQMKMLFYQYGLTNVKSYHSVDSK